MSSTSGDAKARVALVACPDYDRENVQAAVDRCIELITGSEGLVQQGERVLVKPNLLMGIASKHAVTTHPAALSAVLEVIKEAGGQAEVGDNPMFQKLEPTLRRCELLEPTKEGGAELADMATAQVIQGPAGRRFRRFEVTRSALEADLLINLFKIKAHGITGLTLSIKNLFGLLPGLDKSKWHLKAPSHPDMSSMIVDLFEALQGSWEGKTRVLHLCEGVIGLEGEGPGPGGVPKQVGVFAASFDAVAIDAVLARVVGFDDDQVTTTAMAAERGLGVADLDRIEILGDDLEELSLAKGEFEPNRGSLRSGLMRWPMNTKFMRNRMVERPVIALGECVGCGECRKVCAAKAITLYKPESSSAEPTSGADSSDDDAKGKPKKTNKKARIDYDVCIRCYCCIEVCQYKAANLGPRPFLAKVVDNSHLLPWTAAGVGLFVAGGVAYYFWP